MELSALTPKSAYRAMLPTGTAGNLGFERCQSVFDFRNLDPESLGDRGAVVLVQ
jgi:hypothetical protein